MTIDEAIEDAKKFVRKCDDQEVAFRVMQVAEWLREARGAEKAARWYTTRIRELKEERDTYRDIVGCMVHPDVCDQLQAENAKLRSALKALMTGTNRELCADRDAPQCRACSMRGEDDKSCVVTDAMELLGIEML